MGVCLTFGTSFYSAGVSELIFVPLQSGWGFYLAWPLTFVRGCFALALNTYLALPATLSQKPAAWAQRGDLDLTTSTDSEDLALLVGDVFEFGQQDATLAVDALSDFFVLGTAGLLAGGASKLVTWLVKRR